MSEPDHSASRGSRFELLVQSVTDYAIYMLDPSGVVTSWNEGARRLKGYEPDEIVGEHFSRFYTPEERDDVPKLALETAKREGRFEADGWRIRKDGTYFWANVVIDPIRDHTGELVGFAKVTRDLTERKQTQEELERTKEAFFQSQKLEAIGKLTEGVAHDFNNLLAVVIGSLLLAERRISQGVDVSGLLGNAIKAAERGTTLTQRMLAYTNRQELTLEVVDLFDFVRGVEDLLPRMLGASITIDTKLPLNLPKVQADVRKLELAVMNLAVNARDAMPNGGTITITAQHECLVTSRAGLERGDYVRLMVIDEGEGMDEQTLAQATEPFFTTKSIGSGSGLGLPMVQGFAQQSGGKLVLKSLVGAGTTAEIWMRVVAAQAREAHADTANVASKTPPATTSSLIVLAVDDDPLVLENTVAMLTELGHKVLQASSGAEALQKLDQHPVDLVVTDYTMPGMTGEELADCILTRQPMLPVLMVSGYAKLPEGERSSVPQLSKPFREHELSQAIAELLALKRAA